MDCPSCGAKVMLGSAQCSKCGSSLLGGAAPPSSLLGPQQGLSSLGDLSHAAPGGPPDPPHIHPVEPGSGLGPGTSSLGPPPPPPTPPLPPPPVSMRTGGPGCTAPPPPPPGWQLGGAGPKLGRQIQVGPSPVKQRRSGCGCLFALLVLAGVGAVTAWGFSQFDDLDSFVDELAELAPGVEVNDAGELSLGVEIEGGFPGNQADDYSFVGQGEPVTLVVQGSEDTVLEVFEGDSDTVLASNDDNGPGSRNPILRFDADEGIDYRIRVRPFSASDAVDQYVLVAASMGAPAPGSTDLDLGAIERGSRRVGVVLLSENAGYRFVGGGEVTIEVRSIGESDPRVAVVDANGSTIAGDDDSGAGEGDARVTVSIPADQVVTIVVDGFGDQPAAYELSVR